MVLEKSSNWFKKYNSKAYTSMVNTWRQKFWWIDFLKTGYFQTKLKQCFCNSSYLVTYKDLEMQGIFSEKHLNM